MELCIPAILRHLVILSLAVWSFAPAAVSAADDCSPSPQSLIDLETLLPGEQANAAAAGPFAQGTLFRVSREGRDSSYIFGTLHLSDARLLAQAEQQSELVRRAQSVVLELQPTRDGSFSGSRRSGTPAYVRPKATRTLKDLLRPDEIISLKKALARRGISGEVADAVSPAVLVFLLDQPTCEPRGPARSMDQVIAETARAGQRPVVGLESLEEQLAPFDALTKADARNVLLASMAQAEVAGIVQDASIRLYLQRKGAMLLAWTLQPKLVANLSGPPMPPKFLSALIDDRNIRMHDRLLPLLTKGNAFVAIGILHLPGENGILNRLSRDGYRVETLN